MLLLFLFGTSGFIERSSEEQPGALLEEVFVALMESQVGFESPLTTRRPEANFCHSQKGTQH